MPFGVLTCVGRRNNALDEVDIDAIWQIRLNAATRAVAAVVSLRVRGPSHFYRAMHYTAKRGLVIACCLSVCLYVCDVDGLGPRRSKILETN